MKPGNAYDIAIVGLGCRFPGARDLFSFWANCLANRDQTREVPADRWPLEHFSDQVSKDNDRLACRRGGYLDAPIAFDPVAQGIMPLAVAGGEPEQFLVLDTARTALNDAGIGLDQLDRGRVQVVIGRGNYFNRGNLLRLQHGRIVAQTVGLLAAIHPEWSADDLDLLRRDLKASLPPFEAATIPGQLTNATAGRLAQQFDLSGASFVVDAASASALVALDLGCQALIERRADLALVGGVYAEADVDFPLVFRQLNLLSRSGKARPFSTLADGMLSGEGVGVAVLRRLRDAERAGDRIYAVIKGVGLASDGKGQGLTSPSSKGHARAIRRAYRTADIEADSIGLIEAHGLGVPAADRAELRALGRVFPPREGRPRALSAASSQIGHAMPAAGMAGLIRAALALHHRMLPPTCNVDSPDPRLADCGFELIDNARPWIQGDSRYPRRAGVNAFGFAGISAHAVLEEHSPSADGTTPGAILDWDSEAFLLSASSPTALADRVARLRKQLDSVQRFTLKDLAFTINAIPPGPDDQARLGIVATSQDELIRHLAVIESRLRDPTCRQVRDAQGLYYWAQPLGRENGRLAFLFPGEGSQYPGMLADLCPHFPELRTVLDTADRIALESGEVVPPSQHLFGTTGSVSEALWATDTAVTAVLSSQWAIFQVLLRLGLRPDAVCGHSSGELPAIAAAGALDTERTLERQLSRLAAIFRELEDCGAIPSAKLIAAGTNRAKAESACRLVGRSVVVAIDNCPHQVVLAGPPADVAQVVAHLRGEGVICEELPFARAYHTPGFSAVLDPLAAFYKSLELHHAKLPIYSCSTAERIPESPEAIRQAAVEQWTRPVAFRDTIEAMYRDDLRVFVDVGARGNLCGYVEDILRGRPSFAVAANLPRRSGTTQLNHLVASLFAQGVAIDPTYLYARRRPRRVDLDATALPVQPMSQIEIGFPEMKLSESVISRLHRRSRPAPINGHEFSVDVKKREPEPETWPRRSPAGGNEESRLNGDSRFSDEMLAHRESVLSAPQLALAHVAESDVQEQDQAMLDFLETMNGFLSTQREVMQAYLGGAAGRALETAVSEGNPVHETTKTRSGPEPGPWVGIIKEWEPAQRIVTSLWLDPSGDLVAENHTLGGRRVSALAPDRKGLPVLPFTVMAEMIAQVGALIAPRGLVLESLHDVHAHRWVQFDPGAHLELRGECDPDDVRRIRVTMHHFQEASASTTTEGRLVYEGTACFTDQPAEPIPSSPLVLDQPRPSKFTAERLYDEQWLFHGPPMQALSEVGPVSSDGLSGSITVLPLADLLRPDQPSSFHTDPIALDTFTHLLGCWGLDCLSQGDVIFPLRMGRLQLFGTAPPIGTEVDCRIQIREIKRRFVRVDAELVRPDGLVWMEIRDWQDWRFYWPARYRDVFRAPDSIIVSEELPLRNMADNSAVAVWLEPPGDMGRPVWRSVLEQIQLAPQEQTELTTSGLSELDRTHWLWGRIAAKEAARRLWLKEGRSPRFPADLAIENDPSGRPLLRDLAQPHATDLPAVSIAHADGIVVALAARSVGNYPGIDIELIRECAESSDGVTLSPAERSILDAYTGPERGERSTRIRAARQAAARAAGLEPRINHTNIEVINYENACADVIARVRSVPGSAPSDSSVWIVRVHTERRGEHIWAWTLGERVEG